MTKIKMVLLSRALIKLSFSVSLNAEVQPWCYYYFSDWLQVWGFSDPLYPKLPLMNSV